MKGKDNRHVKRAPVARHDQITQMQIIGLKRSAHAVADIGRAQATTGTASPPPLHTGTNPIASTTVEDQSPKGE